MFVFRDDPKEKMGSTKLVFKEVTKCRGFFFKMMNELILSLTSLNSFQNDE